MFAVRVTGLPAPKGSMKCVGSGKGGRAGHRLVPDNAAPAKAWYDRVLAAGEALIRHHTAALWPLDGPISVDLTFTVPLPPSVPTSRLWPITRSAGDLDKLVRLVLDGLTDAGVWRDDSQVVEITARKAYPHSPAPDLLPEAGALIRLWSTET